MSATPPVNAPVGPTLAIPETPRRRWGGWLLLALGLAAGGVGLGWQLGLLDLKRLIAGQAVELSTLEVDEGPLMAVVMETGTLESADNATIRCKVEALMGQVGGVAGQAAGQAGGRGGAAGQAGGAAGQQPGQQGQPGQAGAQGGMSKTKGAAKSRAGAGASKTGSSAGGSAAGGMSGSGSSGSAGGASGGMSGGGASGGGMSGGGGGGGGSAGGGSGGGGGGGSGGGGGGGGGAGGGAAGSSATTATAASATTPKPQIRSFMYPVMPYVPQPRAVANPTQLAAQAKAQQAAMQAQQQGGGGGRGGRGGRGGGGMGGEQEKPGSTRIIWILPEGTKVKKGDKVCEFDSAAFGDELQAQEIRYAKAKSAVEQVQAVLEVNEITLREYRDGIHPQDLELINQYVATLEIEYDRAVRNLKWSRATAAKGFRSAAQVKADELALEQSTIARKEAKGMAERLEKYTASKILKSLEAKLAAIRADKLAQESVYQLESDRKRKLERMIANCTLYAPRDGIIVYANTSNAFGQSQTTIQEGVTVRENQPIINLPDPNHMRVRAKVNESKVAQIYRGQRAKILVDAFPERLMTGTVSEVTAIGTPVNGPVSDVRGYFATVDIDAGGFDDLRPGLSAEVTFLVEDPRNVTRVPLRALRWIDRVPYAAVVPNGDGSGSTSTAANAPAWVWRSLELGQTNQVFAEVVSGLKPGDRVIAQPQKLPAPRVTPKRETRATVARAGA